MWAGVNMIKTYCMHARGPRRMNAIIILKYLVIKLLSLAEKNRLQLQVTSLCPQNTTRSFSCLHNFAPTALTWQTSLKSFQHFVTNCGMWSIQQEL